MIGETEFYQTTGIPVPRRDPLLQAHTHLRYHKFRTPATWSLLSYRYKAKDTLNGSPWRTAATTVT